MIKGLDHLLLLKTRHLLLVKIFFLRKINFIYNLTYPSTYDIIRIRVGMKVGEAAQSLLG